ncbi:LigB family dioxygenase [Tatumella ptyseos]|uniref:LigB family dioxygenase n=1 Tax=Tatumella ptyseos TaxID=82987 RepID=A0A2X5P203_9GAMM|nr:LigB family dioxygenase [Tatumella ptyseos]
MTASRMPAVFLGHGSPMNVLEENRYTECWRELGNGYPDLTPFWRCLPTGIPAAPR